MTELPFITCGNTRLLNLPHAAEVIHEVWDEDCYRLNEIPDGSIVLDVGAFYGEFGLICRKNKDCSVIAYEPARSNFEIAELNSVANRVRTQYVLYRSAISSIGGCLGSIFYRANHPAGSGSIPCDGGIKETMLQTTLNLAIDGAITSFGRSKTITVKLDCEGSERSIFEDDPSWIQHVHIVTMEWHNHDGDFYAGILEKNGFAVELEGGGPKPRPKWDRSIGGGYLFAKRK